MQAARSRAADRMFLIARPFGAGILQPVALCVDGGSMRAAQLAQYSARKNGGHQRSKARPFGPFPDTMLDIATRCNEVAGLVQCRGGGLHWLPYRPASERNFFVRTACVHAADRILLIAQPFGHEILQPVATSVREQVRSSRRLPGDISARGIGADWRPDTWARRGGCGQARRSIPSLPDAEHRNPLHRDVRAI